MDITALIIKFKFILSYFFVLPLVFVVGSYLSLKLNFLQVTKLKHSFKALFTKYSSKSANFSSFVALAAILGGNLGTGNIAGVAVALSLGGPGSIFWMWVMALLGAMVKFLGAYLGVVYRKPVSSGGFTGGPMYYISEGLGLRNLGAIFAILTIISAFLVGNFVQINSLTLPLESYDISPFYAGLFLAVGTSYVIFGRSSGFVSFVTTVVPFMAILYLGTCLGILSAFYWKLPTALYMILSEAFNISALGSGAAGYGILLAMQSGFDRGLFATDAGVGIAPIMHSKVPVPEHELEEGAFLQGMVGVVAPIIVMLICTVTALVLIVTDAWQDPCIQSTNICIKAFIIGVGYEAAGIVVILTLLLFALTTILTWFYCAQSAIGYLFPCDLNRAKAQMALKVAFVALIPVGAIVRPWVIWLLADVSLNLMLIINMMAIVLLLPKHISKIQEKLISLQKN